MADPYVTSTIRVYIMTSQTRSYELLKEYEDVPYSTERRFLDIPLPVRFVANAKWYKIKVTVNGVPIDIYNIERRFRVKGKSR